MTTVIERIPRDDLVRIGIAGAGVWIAFLVAWGLAPSAPDGDYNFPSVTRLAASGVTFVAWTVAVFFAAASIRIRGSGARFQVLRVIAFAPVWMFAVLPPAFVALMVALTQEYL